MARAALAAFVILSAFFAKAQTAANESSSHLHSFLENFRKDPKTTMNTVPTKYDVHGNVVNDASTFSEEQIQNRDFVSAKDKIRSKITFDPSSLVMADIDRDNNPKSILENSHFTNIQDLGKPALAAGEVAVHPWSSDYWATFRGGLSMRYSDGNAAYFTGWQQFKPFFTQLIGVNFQDPIALDDRSPAEKYDLLMGDKNFTFTKWWVGKATKAEDSSGKVETWQGICHGWAPASYMMPRPTKVLSVTLEDGQTLHFYPDDLKALADSLFANNRSASAFIGKRCNEKQPRQDENGRVLSSACWDLNPGSFHTILLNRVGVDKKSLVMDATYDYEVWNQPIVSYSFTYFNPQTTDQAGTLKEATVARKDFKSDTFAKYRSPNTVAMVGVQMTVVYTAETYSTHATTNSDDDDSLRMVEYVYDLELDKDNNIIGGEWYQNAHPDFMWTPLQTAKPLAFTEPALYFSWNPMTNLPTDQTKELATRASANGQVLYSVVQKLMQMASH